MRLTAFQSRLLGLQDNLLSFAYKLTANYDDAYDLLQDTTCRVLLNEQKYVDDSNFKSWVFTIMRNIFINNYRKVARTQSLVDKRDDICLMNLSEAESNETPEAHYTLKEVLEMVDRLPREYRTPFIMHASGYKYQEIADKMNLPLGTIKSRIFFAKRKLQMQLSGSDRYEV